MLDTASHSGKTFLLFVRDICNLDDTVLDQYMMNNNYKSLHWLDKMDTNVMGEGSLGGY